MLNVKLDDKAFEAAIKRHEENFENELKNIDPNAVILKVKKALLEQARQNNSSYNATLDMKLQVNDLSNQVSGFRSQVRELERELEETKTLFLNAIKILDTMPKKPEEPVQEMGFLKALWNYIKWKMK